jgi:hypothetical protein
MRADGLAVLKECLSENKVLRRLDLRGNKLGPKVNVFRMYISFKLFVKKKGSFSCRSCFDRFERLVFHLFLMEFVIDDD